MVKWFAILSVVALSGCAQIQSLVPSFWDDNQSARIVDVRVSIESVNCEHPQLMQIQKIHNDLRWFELYSQSKGRRQQDVVKIIKPMQESVDDWRKRAGDGHASKTYCELKKKVLSAQAERAAAAILGRF